MARHGFPMPRGGGQDLSRAGIRPAAKASRHGARAKGFVPRRNTPRGEGLPTRRTSERICAHARTRPSAKASRHGAKAKGFVPRRNTPLDEGLPTRRTGEGICPAQERSPQQRPPDTAHGRKDLPTRERSPRRRPPDTAHERKDLPRAETLSSAKPSRHGARAKGFAPRRNAPHGEGLPTRRTGERICPAGVRVRPTCRRTAGRPRATDCRKNTPSAGSHPRRRGRCRVHSH